METELLNLAKSENPDELRIFIEKSKVEEIVCSVTKCVQTEKPGTSSLIKSIFEATKNRSSVNAELYTKLYTEMFRVLEKNEINSKVSFGIISLLLIEVESLPSESLAKLARYFVDSIKNGTFTGGKASDILPKILCVINASEEIHFGEDCIKGSEFKSHIINSLCSSRWKPSTTVVMATLFHDIHLTGDELKFVLNKIIRMFPDMELSDQPALAFQLLQLSSKGHKSLVLEGITNFYKAEDDKNRGRSIMIDSEDLLSETTCLTTLRQVEGTVILHIVQAIKQDQELGRELIKYFKTLQLSDAPKIVAPFNLLLLLSVSQLHHCEEQIFDFVKTTIFKCVRDEMRQQQSLWIQECFPTNIKTTDLVLEAVDHSTYDWDYAVQSLVQMGFDLMESYGPRLVFGQMPEAPTPNEHLMSPQQLTCKLGRQVLLKTFKAHEVVRTEILDQIFKNIITRSTQPVSHYLDLLSDTVQSAPQLLLESSSKIQQVILELAQLPPLTAQNLLSAIQPLVKLSPMLKDSLLLVLRKAMFSRQLDARKIGAIGFLIILKSFKVVGGLPSSQVSQPFALSQISVEVHSRYNAASNEALCLEILGNLRRCFTQQADVRLGIYQGLYEVLHRNSQLRNPVLDMLLSQMKKYFDKNENSPPLRLEPCIQIQGEQVYLIEPLSHLLRSVQQCVRKSIDIASQMTEDDDDDDEDESMETRLSLTQLKSILTSLVKRMIKASLGDFELDKSADFSLTTTVGMKNNIYCILLLGIYEILMEYVCETGNFNLESCNQISELFTGYSKLTAMVKDKMAGKKGKAPSTKIPMSLMSVQCVINFIKAFVNNCNKKTEEGVAVLQQSRDFFPYLVNVAVQKLEQVAGKGLAEGEIKREEKIFKQYCTLGRLFFKHYVENQIADDAAGDREKNTTTQCLEAFSQVITIASRKEDQAIFYCLSHLERDLDDEEKVYVSTVQVVEKVHDHIKKMQRLVMTILNESHDHQNWKEMSTLLSIIGQLTSHLPDLADQLQQTNTWVMKVCTDESVEDTSCCKQLISALLSRGKMKSLPQLLLNLCQDLHTQFGHIDKDYEVDGKTHYTVTKSNCCPPSSILPLVLNQMDSEVDDIDWVIRKRKAQVAATVSSVDEDESMGATQMEQMDRTMCTRLGMLVTGFIELCHSAIPSKIGSHALLKSLTKLYTVLSNLTKFYLSLYMSKNGHMGSRFEKLMNLVGRQLTQPAYCVISYVQMTDNDATSHDGEKKDKSKKEKPNAAQVGMAKAMKQMKITSNLIFAIEQLEKFLIHLSKKSKVNLMEGFKQSTSRDFRINAEITTKAVDEAVSASSSDDDDDDDDERSQGNANQQEKEKSTDSDSEGDDKESGKEQDAEEEPPAKKSKLGGKKKRKI